MRDGQVGYDVLTPLRVEGLAEVLLVDRGWLARGARRSDVPVWQTPAGEVTLIGYLHRPVDVPLVTGDVSESFGGRWVVSQIDPALLGKHLGMPVQARVLRLAPQSEHGFRRDWPLVSMTPQRHYGYAVQWFGLAGALFGIYLVAGLRRAPARHDGGGSMNEQARATQRRSRLMLIGLAALFFGPLLVSWAYRQLGFDWYPAPRLSGVLIQPPVAVPLDAVAAIPAGRWKLVVAGPCDDACWKTLVDLRQIGGHCRATRRPWRACTCIRPGRA